MLVNPSPRGSQALASLVTLSWLIGVFQGRAIPTKSGALLGICGLKVHCGVSLASLAGVEDGVFSTGTLCSLQGC